MNTQIEQRNQAVELIVEQYQKLRNLNPEHELLQYITNVSRHGFDFVKYKYGEFCERFKTPSEFVHQELVTYYMKLTEALEPKKVSEKVTKINSLESIANMPF